MCEYPTGGGSVAGLKNSLLMSISTSYPPERLADLVRYFGPAGSHILQFARTHDGELTPDPATVSPQPDTGHNTADAGERRTAEVPRSPASIAAVVGADAAQRLSPRHALPPRETAQAPSRSGPSRNIP